MQLRLLLAAIGLFGMLAFSQETKAQSIAVGAPSLEDYLRRMQLTGKVDSASSFMIRPLILEKFRPSSIVAIKGEYCMQFVHHLWH